MKRIGMSGRSSRTFLCPWHASFVQKFDRTRSREHEGAIGGHSTPVFWIGTAQIQISRWLRASPIALKGVALTYFFAERAPNWTQGKAFAEVAQSHTGKNGNHPACLFMLLLLRCRVNAEIGFSGISKVNACCLCSSSFNYGFMGLFLMSLYIILGAS